MVTKSISPVRINANLIVSTVVSILRNYFATILGLYQDELPFKRDRVPVSCHVSLAGAQQGMRNGMTPINHPFPLVSFIRPNGPVQLIPCLHHPVWFPLRESQTVHSNSFPAYRASKWQGGQAPFESPPNRSSHVPGGAAAPPVASEAGEGAERQLAEAH